MVHSTDQHFNLEMKKSCSIISLKTVSENVIERWCWSQGRVASHALRQVASEENTYLYLASLQLLYLDLCWGKNTFSPPLPFNLGLHTGWLIDFLIKYFVSFLTAGTLMYIRLLMYPVQMPSLMYLIFAKKPRITFFDPLWAGGLAENFSPWSY